MKNICVTFVQLHNLLQFRFVAGDGMQTFSQKFLD